MKRAGLRGKDGFASNSAPHGVVGAYCDHIRDVKWIATTVGCPLYLSWHTRVSFSAFNKKQCPDRYGRAPAAKLVASRRPHTEQEVSLR